MTRFGIGLFTCAFAVALLNCAPPPPTAKDPVVSSVSPATVDVGGNEPITITGSNFEGGSPGAKVALGSNQCLDVIVKTANQITCITPQVETESKVDVIVTNGGAEGHQSKPCLGCLEFKDIKGPRVTEVFPGQDSTVSILVSAKAKFNEKLDPTTVSNQTFYMAGTGVTGTTYCNFDCKQDCATATNVTALCFKPSQPLGYSGNFTGNVKDSIKDLKGNKTQTPPDGILSWSFSTRCINCGNPWLGDIAAASGFTSSEHYSLYSVTGQPTPVGEATSDHYKLKSGFIYAGQQ